MSSVDNPLHRAHALSAQASVLLRPTNSPRQSLEGALAKYREAAELFERASKEDSQSDDATKRTLQLLTTQHLKLARDLERRIASLPSTSAAPSSARPTRQSPPSPQPRQGPGDAPAPFHAVGGAGSGGWQAGLGSRLSPSALPLPPFALLPPSQPPRPPAPASSATAAPPPVSPLYSSSSSSSFAAEDSYVHYPSHPSHHGGGGGGNVDPFSRFWGKLEGMRDEVSRPVGFASLPLEGTVFVPEPAKDRDNNPAKERKSKGKGKMAGIVEEDDNEAGRDKITAKGKGAVRRNRGPSRGEVGSQSDGGPSPSESFYVVPSKDPPDPGRVASQGTSGKTPEELALENTSLRASLDALAIHAQGLERHNKALQAQVEGRQAARGEVVERTKGHGAGVDLADGMSNGGDAPALQKRMKELENEAAALRAENIKQKAQIDKYKERFDKIKQSARAKKEARRVEGQAREEQE